MKLVSLILALASLNTFAQSSAYVNFVRQIQQGTNVVWDMPVAAVGTAPSALTLGSGGALFQLWTVEQTTAKDYLLDQKLVGAYLPTADITIKTLDPYAPWPRTRVDQPFSVTINVNGLLTGAGLPDAATKVLLEQHIQNYAAGQTTLDPAVVATNSPFSTGYLTSNGINKLNFACSSLKATDPTKATGEEHFIVKALADSTITQSQIASAHVQVLPIASGAISGITSGQQFRFQIPTIQLTLNDLYPRSDTYFMLYPGTSINGVTGTPVLAYPMDRDTTQSTQLTCSNLASAVTKSGTYTVALISSTVYGTELLAPPITFTVNNTISVHATLTDFSN